MNRPAARLLSLLLAVLFFGRAGGITDMAECPPDQMTEAAGPHQHESPAKTPTHSTHQTCKCVGGQCCSVQVGAGRTGRLFRQAAAVPTAVRVTSWLAPVPERPDYVLPPSTAPPTPLV